MGFISVGRIGAFVLVLTGLLGLAVIAGPSVLAQGKGSGEESLHPESVLTVSERADWDALTEDSRQYFLDEVLPNLESAPVAWEEKVDAVRVTVGMVLDIQQQMERDDGFLLSGNRVKCYASTGISWSGAFSSLRCDATMAKIRVKVKIQRKYGGFLGEVNESC